MQSKGTTHAITYKYNDLIITKSVYDIHQLTEQRRAANSVTAIGQTPSHTGHREREQKLEAEREREREREMREREREEREERGERERERERERRENQLYFYEGRWEKTQGLFTSSPRPMRETTIN